MRLTRNPGNSRLLSVFGGLCFFLSAAEYMIPKPLPFLRVGLANLPLLAALDILPFSSFALLVCLKVTGQALVTGSLFSWVFLFSLGGTGVSALLMYALRGGLGKARISFIGVSAAGALASNSVQLLLAYCFVFGESVRYAAAPVLALGIVTGTLLGFAAEYFTGKSAWYADLSSPFPSVPRTVFPAGDVLTAAAVRPVKKSERTGKAREAFCRKNFSAGETAAAGLCMVPALLFNPFPQTRVIQFFFFYLLAWLSGKKNNPFLTAAMIAGIVFFNLLVPYGEILFSVGPFRVTSGALWTGIHRAVTLEALFMLSRCCVRRDLVLPGRFGAMCAEAFRVFAVLGERGQGEKLFAAARGREKGNWINRLDRILVDIGSAQSIPRTEKKDESAIRKKTFVSFRIILVLAVILAWLPLLANLDFR